MATATATAARRQLRLVPASDWNLRRSLGIALILVLFGVLWEAAKWIGGDPWRVDTTLFGLPLQFVHTPPLDWRIASDLSLPHLWTIVAAFGEISAGTGQPLALVLVDSAIYT